MFLQLHLHNRGRFLGQVGPYGNCQQRGRLDQQGRLTNRVNYLHFQQLPCVVEQDFDKGDLLLLTELRPSLLPPLRLAYHFLFPSLLVLFHERRLFCFSDCQLPLQPFEHP